jgi:hypothetical protein
MGEGEHSIDRNLGITRRQLMRRGAVMTGVVAWSSPVVYSFASPSSAQVGTPPETDCPPANLRVGYIKYDIGSSSWVPQAFQAQSNCLGPRPAAQCAALDAHVAQMFNDAGIAPVGDPDDTVCVSSLPDPHCLLVKAAAAKTGGGSGACISPDSGLSLPLCFTAQPGAGISNIQIGVECCFPDEVLALCP